jgi:peroxin-7
MRCQVAFSPFEPNRFAVAAAQNFGIVGNGRQYVFVNDGRGLQIVCAFDTQDGIFDCAWSEENEQILLSACGDGSLKVEHPICFILCAQQ